MSLSTSLPKDELRSERPGNREDKVEANQRRQVTFMPTWSRAVRTLENGYIQVPDEKSGLLSHFLRFSRLGRIRFWRTEPTSANAPNRRYMFIGRSQDGEQFHVFSQFYVPETQLTMTVLRLLRMHSYNR